MSYGRDNITALRAEIDAQIGRIAELEAQNAVLTARLAEAENKSAVPATFYADLPLHERVGMLVSQWNRAIQINQTLEAENAALGTANESKCLKCGHPKHESRMHQGVCTFYVAAMGAECGCSHSQEPNCRHERLNEDGICRRCGADCRGIY